MQTLPNIINIEVIMENKLNIQSLKYMKMDGVKVGIKMILVGY